MEDKFKQIPQREQHTLGYEEDDGDKTLESIPIPGAEYPEAPTSQSHSSPYAESLTPPSESSQDRITALRSQLQGENDEAEEGRAIFMKRSPIAHMSRPGEENYKETSAGQIDLRQSLGSEDYEYQKRLYEWQRNIDQHTRDLVESFSDNVRRLVFQRPEMMSVMISSIKTVGEYESLQQVLSIVDSLVKGDRTLQYEGKRYTIEGMKYLQNNVLSIKVSSEGFNIMYIPIAQINSVRNTFDLLSEAHSIQL